MYEERVMKTIIFPTPMTFDYVTWGGTNEQITLGQDDVTAVLLDDEGYLIEYFYDETPVETTVNFATDAPIMIVYAPNRDDFNIKAAIQERDLYADCFNYQHVIIEDDLMITEDVK